MESATLAPALDALKDSGAELDLYAVINGETGKDNPRRQGFDSALSGDGSPLNVLTGVPATIAGGYSPLWDVNPGQWSSEAIASGQRVRLTSARQFRAAVAAGTITGRAALRCAERHGVAARAAEFAALLESS